MDCKMATSLAHPLHTLKPAPFATDLFAKLFDLVFSFMSIIIPFQLKKRRCTVTSSSNTIEDTDAGNGKDFDYGEAKGNIKNIRSYCSVKMETDKNIY